MNEDLDAPTGEAASQDQANPESGEDTGATPEGRAKLPKWLRTPLAKVGYAVLTAVAVAIAFGLWNYTRDKVAPTPPLRLNVVTNPSFWNEPTVNFGDFTYVVPRKTSEIGKPPPGYSWDWHEWAHGIGGVNTWTNVQLTLEGRHESEVLISGVNVEVLERRPPLKGSAISIPGGGASPSARVVRVDLDRNPPKVTYSDREESKPFAISLPKGEVGVVYIDATSAKYDVEWILRLAVIVDGKPELRTIDDGGKPFRTTSDVNARRFVWSGGRWAG